MFTADFLRAHPDILVREPRALHQIYHRWGRLLSPETGANLNESARYLRDSAGKKPNSDWNVQLGAGTLAPGMSPAKYQTDPTATPSCTNDFVVFGINANGVQSAVNQANGQATIVAFNKLYTGANGSGGVCAPTGGQGGPNYIFSYNTSTLTNGRIRTSPVISLDGTKLAFVESSAGGSAIHVLTIGTSGNNGTNVKIPVIPGTGNNAKLATINYTTANNNHSSPWVDYPSDTAYVGADDGKLYKFTGVFNGTLTEVTGGGWPITVTGAIQMTGPIFDSSTGNLFLGDSRGVLHSVNAITPGIVTNLAVGLAGQPNSQILDAPIVDSNGNVFATSSNDGTSAVVVQASTTNLAQLARIRIGVGSTTGTNVNLYDGDFDNAFYSSENSGHYYLCGTGTSTVGGIEPYRYHLALVGGLLQSDTSPVQISTSTAARCGPLTEFYNPNIGGGTDFFFWGVTSNCIGAGGCIMQLANGATVTTAAATAGTSAVIVDNDASQSGNSQFSNIYYATQGGSQTTRLATKSQQGSLN